MKYRSLTNCVSHALLSQRAQPSECLEFGGTGDHPRTRDKFWYRAMLSDSAPHEGLIIQVGRRPRHKRDEEPHPTLRLMRENPAGILFAKIKAGQLRVENFFDFKNRLTMMRMEEEAKSGGAGKQHGAGAAGNGGAAAGEKRVGKK